MTHSFSTRLRLLLAILLTALLVVPAVASAGIVPPPSGFKPFAADSRVNTPLRDDVPIHPRSAEWVNWLNTDATNSIGKRGGYFNTTQCAMPKFFASIDTPRVQVKLDPTKFQDPAINRSWESVPLTDEMKSANCSDANVDVLQEQADGTTTEWEFWRLKKGTWACNPGTTCSVGAAANWKFTADPSGTFWASHGGTTEDIENDRGFASPYQWIGNLSDPVFLARRSAWEMNVTATGTNVMAGVTTPEDVASGSIEHAVGFAFPDSLAGKYLFPGQRYDGGVAETATVKPMPEGAQLRIRPGFDLDAWAADTQPNTAGLQPAPPLVEMVARAMQKYGAFGRDRSFSCYCFYGEEIPAGQPNPYTAAMNGISMTKGFTDRGGATNGYFPWEETEVIDAPLCTGVSGSGCRPGALQTVDIKLDGQAARVGQPLVLDTRNSLLEFPRKLVEVDVNGDGTFETNVGKAISPAVTPSTAGTRTLAVRVTQQNNATTTGTLSVNVAPADETLIPDQLVDRTGWTGACGTDILVEVTDTTGCHRAEAHAANARLEVRFPDTTLATVSSVDATARVTADPLLTTKVAIFDAANVVRGQVVVPAGANQDVTVTVSGLTVAEVNGLKYVAKTVVSSGSTAADTTSVRNIRLKVNP